MFQIVLFDDDRTLYLAADPTSNGVTLAQEPFDWELVQRNNTHWRISVPASYSVN